jgi:ankyrin repeat protein
MCGLGKAEIVSELLSHGADPNYSDENGQTALHMACQDGHDAAATALILYNANVCAADDAGVTALHMACRNGDLDIVVVLLSGKGPTDVIDEDGKTGLEYARESGHDPIVEYITKEIEKRREDEFEEGSKKLMDACVEGNVTEVLRLLQDDRVDPNHVPRETSRKMPLFFMCDMGNAKIVCALLDNGANPNLVDASGHTPLHLACMHGSIGIACESGHIASAKALITWNADVSAVNDSGMTALHLACSNYHVNSHVATVVQVLLTCKADLAGVNKQGKTALDYARQAGHDDILELFKAEMDERELKLFRAEMDERELEEGVGQELPVTFDVESKVVCSGIEMGEGPNVTVAAQASSGLAPADRVEQLELEVKALKERLRQGQSQLLELTQSNLTDRTTFRERNFQVIQEADSALAEQKLCLEREHKMELQKVRHQYERYKKEEMGASQKHLLKVLAEQKQKLEHKQEQKLKEMRTDAAGASETVRKLHIKELKEMQTALQRQQEVAATERLQQSRSLTTIQKLREELEAAHTLEVELNAASSLAAVSATEQLPGLADAELRELEEAVRNEYTRRQQLTLERDQRERKELQREREEMRKTMRELERERTLQREEREEATLCAICLDRDKDTALNCGHQACAACASEVANCHICRVPIVTRTRLY